MFSRDIAYKNESSANSNTYLYKNRYSLHCQGCLTQNICIIYLMLVHIYSILMKKCNEDIFRQSWDDKFIFHIDKSHSCLVFA